MIPEPLQKELGMDLSAKANYAYLKLAQSMAVRLAEIKGEVSIDDVRAALPSLPAGNYLGSVFKGGKFICTGFTEAKHIGSHARIIKKWKLRAAILSLMLLIPLNSYAGIGYECPMAPETNNNPWGRNEKIIRVVVCAPDEKFLKAYGIVVFYDYAEYPNCPPPFREANEREEYIFNHSALKENFLKDLCAPKKHWWSK